VRVQYIIVVKKTNHLVGCTKFKRNLRPMHELSDLQKFANDPFNTFMSQECQRNDIFQLRAVQINGYRNDDPITLQRRLQCFFKSINTMSRQVRSNYHYHIRGVYHRSSHNRLHRCECDITMFERVIGLLGAYYTNVPVRVSAIGVGAFMGSMYSVVCAVDDSKTVTDSMKRTVVYAPVGAVCGCAAGLFVYVTAPIVVPCATLAGILKLGLD
jgi:hypothetical protein